MTITPEPSGERRDDSVHYLRLVEEAAYSVAAYGAVDLETFALADSLGVSIQTLTKDAEAHLAKPLPN